MSQCSNGFYLGSIALPLIDDAHNSGGKPEEEIQAANRMAWEEVIKQKK
jgi:hypothetical protein